MGQGVGDGPSAGAIDDVSELASEGLWVAPGHIGGDHRMGLIVVLFRRVQHVCAEGVRRAAFGEFDAHPQS